MADKMAKRRTDEEIEEEYYKARLKDPNAKPPEDYTPVEFSPEQLDRLRKLLMIGSGCCPMCSIGERIRRGKQRAKMRRAREAEEAAGRTALPRKEFDK